MSTDRPRRPAFRLTIAAAMIAACATIPAAALAAFELRDASPAALGAVSTDIEAPPLLGAGSLDAFPAGFSRRGGTESPHFRLGASHAALFEVEGLSADHIGAAVGARGFTVEFSFEQVGGPGALEQSARLAIGERSSRAVSLGIAVERLDLSAEGEPRAGGWALGGESIARVSATPVRVEVFFGGERLLRSAGLQRMDIGPSLVAGIRLLARGASVTILDRWEGGGRTSPRVFLDVPLGGVVLIRIGRGESPSRTGTAILARGGPLEAGVGRLDLAWGGAITGLSIEFAPRPKRAGES